MRLQEMQIHSYDYSSVYTWYQPVAPAGRSLEASGHASQ